MNPRLGIFGSLDPLEGESSAPLTMNGYGWVEGNTPNRVDASGMASRTCNIPSANLSAVQSISIENSKYGNIESVGNNNIDCNPLEKVGICVFRALSGGAGHGEAFNPSSFTGSSFSSEFMFNFTLALLGVATVGMAAGAYVIPSLVIRALPATSAITTAITTAKIAAAAGVAGLGINIMEQLHTLHDMPTNSYKDFQQLVRKINVGEAFATGFYSAGSVVLHGLTGGVSTWGAIANAAAYSAFSTNNGGLRSEDLAASMFFGAVMGTGNESIKNMSLELGFSLIQRAIAYTAVGAFAYAAQSQLDYLLTGTSIIDSPVNRSLAYGITNLTGFISHNVLGLFATATVGTIYNHLIPHERIITKYFKSIIEDPWIYPPTPIIYPYLVSPWLD